VEERLRGTSPAEVAVPAVVIYELEFGIAQSVRPEQRRRALDAVLDTFRILPFDASSARASAGIRLQLEQAGRPIGSMDTLITATVAAQFFQSGKTRECTGEIEEGFRPSGFCFLAQGGGDPFAQRHAFCARGLLDALMGDFIKIDRELSHTH
jgi:hypothetical protein